MPLSNGITPTKRGHGRVLLIAKGGLVKDALLNEEARADHKVFEC